MEDVVSGVALYNVYEENELQLIDFDVLLPYWEKAQIYLELFDEHMHTDDPKLNSDYIPSDLAEEYTDDPFAYEFLKMYAGWGFSDYFDECEPMTHRKWYDETQKRVIELTTQAAALDIQEQIYSMDLDRLKQPKGIKLGLVIFALFSVFNIILPLFFCAVPLTGQWCYVVSFCSIGFLSLGLCTTFWYLAHMLKWKEKEI